ncbi:MAG TPA: isoprenylcysteine carboxylmethyltransferase family protein [Patescibacteria group bacterium]|nr:isoprenylcysteine carboxylmethyltransferase family protein [Patescibacteria group bacterium]
MSSVPSLGPRGEGWVVLQFVCLGLVIVAGLFAPGHADATVTTLAFVAGAAAIVLGGSLAMAGVIALQRASALTAVPSPRDLGELVVRGPYRLVRHPIYAGLIVAAFGWAVAWLSGPAALAALLLVVALDLKRRREEAWLIERFEGYRAYRARTKALIPFVY